MTKIASFRVNHRFLESGLYVSMKQVFGDTIITTFDIRITTPYKEPVLSTGVIHTIEHIGATFLRKYSEISDTVIYFGPMGCRTGFYLVVYGDYESESILPIIQKLFEYIAGFNGPIPGASMEECGNYTDMDLCGANQAAYIYLNSTLNRIDYKHLHYQEEEGNSTNIITSNIDIL